MEDYESATDLSPTEPEKEDKTVDVVDVQSVINERRPSKLKSTVSTPTGSNGRIQTHGYSHLYVKDNVQDDVKICVDDTDSQSSNSNKTHDKNTVVCVAIDTTDQSSKISRKDDDT